MEGGKVMIAGTQSHDRKTQSPTRENSDMQARFGRQISPLIP